MDSITKDKLTRSVHPEVMAYAERNLPNLEALLRITKPKRPGSYERNWGPPHPRPKVDPRALEGNLMMEIETAIAQLLHRNGWNLAFVCGDAEKAVWIHWKDKE